MDRSTISVTELRRSLPTVLHHVLDRKESFVILKNGLPFARLSPITDPEENERINKKVNAGIATSVAEEDVLEGALVPGASGP